MLDAALRLPAETVERTTTGDLVARVAGDSDQVVQAAQGALRTFLGSGCTILLTVGGLATLDWRFAVAGLLAVPVQAWTLRWYVRAARPCTRARAPPTAPARPPSSRPSARCRPCGRCGSAR
ncbi:hypothetical protein GCM10025864_09930 [Luteimicrobium album]|uniref:ABC transmembrane type-1 domain-containing protein n=1 Tax=Luteimicrobium album TaxID=1054550 RepID=A0ABQ6HZU7_9MICO|nr:hypothetical protein GCM10025864_09930 [Luteimicrobium album]